MTEILYDKNDSINLYSKDIPATFVVIIGMKWAVSTPMWGVFIMKGYYKRLFPSVRIHFEQGEPFENQLWVHFGYLYWGVSFWENWGENSPFSAFLYLLGYENGLVFFFYLNKQMIHFDFILKWRITRQTTPTLNKNTIDIILLCLSIVWFQPLNKTGEQ